MCPGTTDFLDAESGETKLHCAGDSSLPASTEAAEMTSAKPDAGNKKTAPQKMEVDNIAHAQNEQLCGKKASDCLPRKQRDIRRERWRQKRISKGLPLTPKPLRNPEKTLEERMKFPENGKHKLEIKTIRSCPPSPLFTDSLEESHALYQKYQMAIHKDAPSECTLKHYTRFLCDSPLTPVVGIPELGSFHQQYWLDGKLVAVGVLDFLPTCVSSVYFYYDPDYAFLAFGTYSSLREIHYVRSLYRINSAFRWYYMGYYIHSIPKMRYKGQLRPSFLACPETFEWFPLSDCVPKLDVSAYARFNSDCKAVDKDAVISQEEIDQNVMMVEYSKRRVIPFGLYRRRYVLDESDLGDIATFARLVGLWCLRNRLYLLRTEDDPIDS